MKKIFRKLKTILADLWDVLDAALFSPILDQWHPGQPHLVEFVMRRPDSDNASGAVANITALAGAGYRPSAEQVSELTGLDVEDTGAPKAPEGSEGDWTNPQGLPRRGELPMGGGSESMQTPRKGLAQGLPPPCSTPPAAAGSLS